MDKSEESEIKKSTEAEKHQESKENAQEGHVVVQTTINSRKLKDQMTNSIESSDSGDDQVMQQIDEEKMK